VNYALTTYPASRGLRERLNHALAVEPVYLSLAELRRTRLRTAVGRLRSLRGARLVIQLEDDNSRAALPLLKAVAALSNARSIEVRDSELRAETISLWRLRAALLSLAWASVAAGWAAVLTWLDASRLLRTARMTSPTPGTGRAIHLNANLWFGVKAGGSIGHVAGVVNGLDERGCAVVHASAGSRTMIRERIPQIDLAAPRAFGVPYELNYYRFGRAVVRQLAQLDRPRFIYQRMSIANYSGVTLSRAWRVPLVLEYNGSEVWVARHWGQPLQYPALAERAEAACLRHAHVVVTISDVLRDELVERGVPPERIVCYPNCIDPLVFDPGRFSDADRAALRRRLGIPADAVVCTFVGTFGQWHGADLLATAIRRLAEQHADWVARAKPYFLLVGDGLRMPEVRRALDHDHCRRIVKLAGLVPQSESPLYLAASDVLLSPHVGNPDGTRFFGSPTKLFEYMAMEKAIVASDLDQIGVVLENSVRFDRLPAGDPGPRESRLAVLSAPGDVDALIRSVRFAVDRPAWRRALARNARAEAMAKYTWAHHVDAVLAAVEAVR